MKHAVSASLFGPFGDVRLITELAVGAERAGWDGFFVWVHVAMWFDHGVPLGAAAAGVTWWAEDCGLWRFGVEDPRQPWPAEAMRKLVASGPARS